MMSSASSVRQSVQETPVLKHGLKFVAAEPNHGARKVQGELALEPGMLQSGEAAV